MISFNLSTLIDIAPALQALVIDLLAAIIAIRTLLSLTLEVEMTGRWPWQRGAEK